MSTSTDANKAIVERFVDEACNKGNLSAVDELVAADAVDHSAPPGFPPGAAGVKQLVAMFRGAFPDLETHHQDTLVEGDKVAVRPRISGTHNGPFMGIGPTGRRVTVEGIAIYRLAGGRIVEHWGQLDILGLLQQLGALPAPGSPSAASA